MPVLPVNTIVELLRERARLEPERVGYTFLDFDPSRSPGSAPPEPSARAGAALDGETARDRTYGTLDRRARAVAAWLEANVARGDRALVMFEEGLEYLDALFGCMYAGVLAVPVHAPDPHRLQRTLPRLVNISKDAGVTAVLTTTEIAHACRDVPELAEVRWLTVDTLDESLAERWTDPGAGPDDLAYLQYTSGSTALPKGVQVSHRNLVHQLADFDTGYGHTPDSVLVSWLPATHDLGLVYARLMPLWVGFRCVFFSAAAFMQKPSRWMAAMSRWKGTHSPSPNFGFEVAARKADLTGLDLRHVKVLINGAEPIRQESEELFTETYGRAGLPKAAVTHAMGMSEATAKIMTEPIERYPPRFVHIDGAAYEQDRVVLVARGAPGSRTVASNGVTLHDTVVEIVHPETHDKLGQDRVGEMWVKGTTVAEGYWNNPEATAHTFRARTTDGDGPFLRTGDLAFVHEGEIYLCGRLKDVIIVRGQNHHPQDLEWTVGNSHPALRPNCAAAFGTSDEEGEHVVLVTEVYEERVTDPEAVLGAIRQALGEHGVAARSIVLLPARGLPKTSSGKIQRSLAKHQFLDGTLPTFHRWDAPRAAHPPATTPAAPAAGLRTKVLAAHGRRRTALLMAHIQGVAAELLGLAAADVEVDRPLGELGIDSVTAVDMVEKVGRDLGLTLQGTLLFDHPTIEALARHLLEQVETPT